MKSNPLFAAAKQVIPGGVNSPVRAFRSVGGDPIFAKRGKGSYFWDESGKRYFDFCCSWGPLIFGHSPTGLIQCLKKEMIHGTSFGIATKKEVILAQKIREFFPSMEKIRLTSSGTEAVMSAIRLARGFTGRKKIVKIDGGYHGHVDSLLVKAGSGGATFGIPDSAGIPEELAKLTLTVAFNDLNALTKLFQKEGQNIAAFILEPVPANMGVVLPESGYLQKVRELTRKHGALLIFDEVITGFRVSQGGAQEYFEIEPDLTTLGKIIGGGFPIAAYGGRKEIMDQLAPEGPVYQAGTLSGNPVCVSAALWMLEQLQGGGDKKKNHSPLEALNEKAQEFFVDLGRQIQKKNLPIQLNCIASMFTLFFTAEPVTDYASAKKSDTKKYARFFNDCLKKGVYLAPSQFEANFISTAQTKAQLVGIKKILVAAAESACS